MEWLDQWKMRRYFSLATSMASKAEFVPTAEVRREPVQPGEMFSRVVVGLRCGVAGNAHD